MTTDASNPKLHILYDPTGRIQTDELPKHVKVAMMSVGDIDLSNIGSLAERLTCLLLEQIQKEES